MLRLKKTILLGTFVLATLSSFAQSESAKVQVPPAKLSDIKLFNAGFLSFTSTSFLLVMHRFSNKVIIKMYESTNKPGVNNKSIKISDEAGVLQPRPGTVVFKSPNMSVNLTLDDKWYINTSSLPADTYSISINGKKIVEEFIVN